MRIPPRAASCQARRLKPLYSKCGTEFKELEPSGNTPFALCASGIESSILRPKGNRPDIPEGGEVEVLRGSQDFFARPLKASFQMARLKCGLHSRFARVGSNQAYFGQKERDRTFPKGRSGGIARVARFLRSPLESELSDGSLEMRTPFALCASGIKSSILWPKGKGLSH